MDPEERGKRIGEESNELMFRYFAARNNDKERALMAPLKERFEKRDPNVTRTEQESGDYLYSLRFTKEQFEQLKSSYLKYRPEAQVLNIAPYDSEWLENEAIVFVRVIEGWGAELYFGQGRMPPHQKERKRSMESVNISLYKLKEALDELDTDALAYWYGHVADSLSKAGYQVSEADNRIASMLRAPMRAAAESQELRNELGRVIKDVSNATITAAETLPKFNHTEYDPRYRIAQHLERFVIEQNIHFDSTENGFAAICLRAMFDLAGVEYEKISYWLKKAEDNEDSHARWLQKMRDQG